MSTTPARVHTTSIPALANEFVNLRLRFDKFRKPSYAKCLLRDAIKREVQACENTKRTFFKIG